LCVLFSTLMVGIVVKFVIDNHLGSGDIKVLRQNPEELSLRLDVNAVTWQELLPLPKIGEKRAKAIIKYRGEHGAFTDLNELLDVPGITLKVFETVKGSMKISSEDIKVYGERLE
ncbi:MAG: helix-hairpin-helix domain-containing protein, partial [Candidatus Brocadiales bacterium]